ncbi:MAG: hypothetical protein ACKVG5_09520 [Acidimicrobiales bacterium]|jgi:hypothetical protein|tara:strand:+ start:500 stop:691 length:192 start_codon:yes stop_codon:yes gene_type:complete
MQAVRDRLGAMMDRQPVRLFETMGIGSSGDKLNEHGEVADPVTITDFVDFVARFAEHCATPGD